MVCILAVRLYSFVHPRRHHGLGLHRQGPGRSVDVVVFRRRGSNSSVSTMVLVLGSLRALSIWSQRWLIFQEN